MVAEYEPASATFATPVARLTRGTLPRRTEMAPAERTDNLNQKGWKMCHLTTVNTGQRLTLTTAPLQTLQQLFINLMNPSPDISYVSKNLSE